MNPARILPYMDPACIGEGLDELTDVEMERDHYRDVCQMGAALQEERDHHRERIATLEAAVRWALGEEGEFTPRLDGGRYWWRTELRARAAIRAAMGSAAAPSEEPQ